MLARYYRSDLATRTKRWRFFMVLSMIALFYISCSDATHQISSSRQGTVQSPHTTKAKGMPLTDSESPQGDMTPMVSASTPESALVTTDTYTDFLETRKRSWRPWDASQLLHFCLPSSVFLREAACRADSPLYSTIAIPLLVLWPPSHHDAEEISAKRFMYKCQGHHYSNTYCYSYAGDKL